ALSIREAPPPEDTGVLGLHLGPELLAKAGLPDAGGPDHGDEMRAPVVDHPFPRGAQDLELTLPPDHRHRRDRPLGGPDDGLEGEPGGHRLLLALHRHRLYRLVADR